MTTSRRFPAFTLGISAAGVSFMAFSPRPLLILQ